MALPGSGPRFEYCEIRFVPVRESGSIFDGSGYFSVRRVSEAGELLPDVFFSSMYCSTVIHAAASLTATATHQCSVRAVYLAELIRNLRRDGWQVVWPANRQRAAQAAQIHRQMNNIRPIIDTTNSRPAIEFRVSV